MLKADIGDHAAGENKPRPNQTEYCGGLGQRLAAGFDPESFDILTYNLIDMTFCKGHYSIHPDSLNSQ